MLPVLKLSRLGWCFKGRGNKSQDPHSEYMLFAEHQQEIKESPSKIVSWTRHISLSPCTAGTPVPLEAILSTPGGRLGHVRFISLIPHITSTNSSFQATFSGVLVQQCASIQRPRPSSLANASIRGQVEFGTKSPSIFEVRSALRVHHEYKL